MPSAVCSSTKRTGPFERQMSTPRICIMCVCDSRPKRSPRQPSAAGPHWPSVGGPCEDRDGDGALDWGGWTSTATAFGVMLQRQEWLAVLYQLSTPSVGSGSYTTDWGG